MILGADFHFSHQVPTTVPNREEWYATMGRRLDELKSLSREYNVPIVCAGDFFNSWNEPPELINFIISKAPQFYGVPGQHDLPHHSIEDIGKSAYWTLVEAKVIHNLFLNHPVPTTYCNLHGFPFGKEIKPLKSPHDFAVEVAVIHKYLWISGKGYKDAPKENRLKKWKRNLRGYDIAVVGDNHQSFQTMCGNCRVFNTGPLFRRRSDEMQIRPSVGLLHFDKTITRHYFDTSKDKHVANAIIEGERINMGEVISELTSLGDKSLDFDEAVRQAMDKMKVSKGVRHAILEAQGRKHGN